MNSWRQNSAHTLTFLIITEWSGNPWVVTACKAAIWQRADVRKSPALSLTDAWTTNGGENGREKFTSRLGRGMRSCWCILINGKQNLMRRRLKPSGGRSLASTALTVGELHLVENTSRFRQEGTGCEWQCRNWLCLKMDEMTAIPLPIGAHKVSLPPPGGRRVP